MVTFGELLDAKVTWRLTLEFAWLDPDDPEGLCVGWEVMETYDHTLHFIDEEEAWKVYREAKAILDGGWGDDDYHPCQAMQDFPVKYEITMTTDGVMPGDRYDYPAKLALQRIREFLKVEDLTAEGRDPSSGQSPTDDPAPSPSTT